NPGFLDVLHDAGDIAVLAVGEAIDINLHRVGEIAVDKQRPLVGNGDFRRAIEVGGKPRDIAVELMCIVNNLHRPAAEHVSRPDHDRITHTNTTLLRVTRLCPGDYLSSTTAL